MKPAAPPSPAPALELGSIVAGRYRLESILGHGLSSTVFAARQLPGESVVAIKLLHAKLTGELQLSRRFQREARILSSLSGPHLAQLLDFGETEQGQPFMALELVDGVTLDQEISSVPFSSERALRLGLQICDALKTAHGAGVIHRDLKPANVVVENAGTPEERVRVLDFGMAKILRGNLNHSVNALTQQNMVFGTPEYMAPEQARGEEVDERSDIYAVGIILYEMLTGELPFRSNTPIGAMTAHLVEEPEAPSKRVRGRSIAPALEAVVLHALAKRPEDRYPTAEILAEALRGAAARPDDVASMRPPTLAPQFRDSDPIDNPMPRDELANRDTDLELHMTAALRKTELPKESLGPIQTNDAPAGKAWVLIAVVAALFGVLMGVAMSLVGTLR